MSLAGKLLLGLVLTSTQLFALGIVMVDLNFGLFNDQVVGNPLKYAIQSASLTGPSTGSGPFTLVVNTNYGASLPGSPDVIPSFTEDGITLRMGDFLIHQGSNYYGIVLSAHDGYIAGDVYRASGFQNSVYFNPGWPVSILPGGDKIATGTVSAAPNAGCNGVNCAEFRVTDTFNIDPSFTFIDAKAPFTALMADATCGNALLVGENTEIPETATSWLMGLGMAALLARAPRASRRSAAKSV